MAGAELSDDGMQLPDAAQCRVFIQRGGRFGVHSPGLLCGEHAVQPQSIIRLRKNKNYRIKVKGYEIDNSARRLNKQVRIYKILRDHSSKE